VRRARIVLALVGLVLLVRGVLGTLTDPGTHLAGELAFLATVLIGHDAIVLPVAIGIGAAVARWAPPPVRGPAQAGLFASAVLTFVALPLVIGAGAIPDNPSALPLNYGRGLAVSLAAVWVVVGGVLGYRLLTASRKARRDQAAGRDGRA
jgi:hypothetical protein